MPYPPIVIFTDLDGTLLDHCTYEWVKAQAALDQCKNLDIPVILVSSKTSAEMDRLRKTMGLIFPFISENGGGIFFPKEMKREPPKRAELSGDLFIYPMGMPYPTIIISFRKIREDLGLKIRGFSDMNLQEISRLTGLDMASSELAAMREFDEPFIVEREDGLDLSSLYKRVAEKGLKVTKGGRFYHLHGKSDKGKAIKKLTSWYREVSPGLVTIGLGDSPNDFSMLKQVDEPILVRSSRFYPDLEREIPGIKITKEIGPEGWNSSILGILGKKNNGGVFRYVRE